MAARSSKEIVAARATELAGILLDGATSLDVQAFIREKEQQPESLWFVGEGCESLSYAQVCRYRSKAERLISATVEKDKGKLFKTHLAIRRRLYAMAISQGDVRAALQCADSEAKLLGLFPEAERQSSNVHADRIILNINEVLVQNDKPPSLITEVSAAPVPLIQEVHNGTNRINATDDSLAFRAEELP